MNGLYVIGVGKLDMPSKEYCCDNFKEAVEKNIISNKDPSDLILGSSDLDGWYILKKESNWVDGYDYYMVGDIIKYCPWCMTPIIYENI